MKDSMDSAAVGRALEPEGFSNRKLIRPSLSRSDQPERRERASERGAASAAAALGKKTPPPEQTHAENFYYQKQMQARTPMVLVLQDGEAIHGIIEWYDKSCLKVNRNGQPNLLIYKSNIRYMYKESEQRETRGNGK
jgi:sRNA-binding regulator protein Hfq